MGTSRTYKIEDIDKFIFQQAKLCLLNQNIDGVNSELIEKYLTPEEQYDRPNSMPIIFERFLVSAQNANMKSGVIGGAIGGINNLSSVLHGFNHQKVLDVYLHDSVKLLDEIVSQLNIKVRRTNKSIWPKYCKTILSVANFLNNFKSAKELYVWFDAFNNNYIVRPALPMLLSKEIYGFGFALSCDFVKELGYVNFPKPDIHLKDIFVALKLCPEDADDYALFKSIIRVAKNSNVSPYTADKIFWLIGSGKFYNDSHIGKSGKIGSLKTEFIVDMKKKLKQID